MPPMAIHLRLKMARPFYKMVSRMKVIPILTREPEQIEERLRLFHALGCEVYQDSNGQLFAVAQSMTAWLRNQMSLVFETDQIASHWNLIKRITDIVGLLDV